MYKCTYVDTYKHIYAHAYNKRPQTVAPRSHKKIRQGNCRIYTRRRIGVIIKDKQKKITFSNRGAVFFGLLSFCKNSKLDGWCILKTQKGGRNTQFWLLAREIYHIVSVIKN